ncbi:preprotein translocase subunit SecA [Flammeovirga pectinis]|uniref:Protein translocase subunit SecA n=1 Tax=Flammeovirga pectinis TaxID=2494373 RepID=A0A3Q9FMZ0_9BACT|nr:preprotein translocase subunit SecA [Flammeovirga pectinis]AZQ60900.1 preprotein translocase subunit SecA [Flammeovirga pectinis]
MIQNFLQKIFGSKSGRDLKSLLPVAVSINREYLKLRHISDDELRNKTVEFINYIDNETTIFDHKETELDTSLPKEEYQIKLKKIKTLKQNKLERTLEKILPKAFAVVKETARRFTHQKCLEVIPSPLDRELAEKHDYVVIEGDKAIWTNEWRVGTNNHKWDMIHYDVQLIAGVVLHEGKIAQMNTGEGKTLASTLPIYLNALAQKGVHVITVNDYLAKRDAEWNAPIFQFLGLTVDCIENYPQHSLKRKNAYNADITYGTNSAFGFDYLFDNMVKSKDEVKQRGHHFAILDEVDSVLIDDARTPLIISGQAEQTNLTAKFDELKPLMRGLVRGQRNLITESIIKIKRLNNSIDSNVAGKELLKVLRGAPNNTLFLKYLNEYGVKQLLQKAQHQYSANNDLKMHEIDETLFYVIDLKNKSVELTNKGMTFINEQVNDNFFVLPDLNITYNTEEEKNIATDLYELKVEKIFNFRQLLKANTLFTKDIDYVIEEHQIKLIDEQTGRIMEGRRLSDGLHQAIEAKESLQIEDASQTHASISLQNYFKMYSKLSGMTGTAETEANEFWKTYKLDILVVPTNLKVERVDLPDRIFKTHKRRLEAVVLEIIGQSNLGRPVLVGTSSVEGSELLSKLLNKKNVQHKVLNAKSHRREADIISKAGVSGAITIATNMAGRGTDIKLSKEALKAGGLAVIGTCKHESRRIDQQLRGRSGRQGDVGSSQFFLSLEDEIVRLYASNDIARLEGQFKHFKNGEIFHKNLDKIVTKSQISVEENNFSTRKKMLEFDNVINLQRDIIYNRRQNTLFNTTVKEEIDQLFLDVITQILLSNSDNFKEFNIAYSRAFGRTTFLRKSDFLMFNQKDVIQLLLNEFLSNYTKRFDKFEYSSDISVYTFFDKSVVVDLKKNDQSLLIDTIQRAVMLDVIDRKWKQHLLELEKLKQEVQNAVYEQKEPITIFKVEAFNLFKQLIEDIDYEIVTFLSRGLLGTRKVKQPIAIKVMNSPVENEPNNYQRNQKVTVEYTDGSLKKDIKYKNISTDLQNGNCTVVK